MGNKRDARPFYATELRALRGKHTQREWGKLIGMSYVNVCKVECGTYVPSAKHVLGWFNAAGRPLCDAGNIIADMVQHTSETEILELHKQYGTEYQRDLRAAFLDDIVQTINKSLRSAGLAHRVDDGTRNEVKALLEGFSSKLVKPG